MSADTLVPVQPGDHILGAERPELAVIEYGDFGCPFCFAADRPMRTLLDRYETLAVVWRHYPDPQLHPGADLAAELSEFAGSHGMFWEAHSLLLAGRDHFSMEDLLSVARELGLDPGEAENALTEHSFREPVLEDVATAEQAGVHATPTFFIGEERLVGHWSQLGRRIPEILGDSQAGGVSSAP
jgi:predicted DsbA family dithiol-disulfide isomerase